MSTQLSSLLSHDHQTKYCNCKTFVRVAVYFFWVQCTGSLFYWYLTPTVFRKKSPANKLLYNTSTKFDLKSEYYIIIEIFKNVRAYHSLKRIKNFRERKHSFFGEKLKV